MRWTTRALLLTTAFSLACGGRQAQPTTADPAAGEVSIDEPSVVVARRGAEAGLPPLPSPLEHGTPDFQRGYALAVELLSDPGPMPPPDTDAAAYERWTRGEFTRWIEARGRAVDALIGPLQRVARGPASEHVVAAALLGMVYERTYQQFMGIAAPPGLRDDPALADRYRLGLHGAAQKWLDEANKALYHCADHSARQRDPAFALWLQVCHDHMATLATASKQARALEARIRADDEAARRAAIGPRPAGPEACWRATTAEPAAAAEPPAAAAESAVEGKPSAEAEASAAPAEAGGPAPAAAEPGRCAGELPAEPEPRTPRDRAYGVLDAETGVRVWVEAEPRVAPLRTADTQQRLARCYQQHVAAPEEVTIAVQATVRLSPRGEVRGAELKPEPSDSAAAPSAALRRCLLRALRATPFGCVEDGVASRSALLCLRREAVEEPASTP